MKIDFFHSENFKNLKSLQIYPDEKMNVICGENAQGKTNIIEAMWLFTGAKSFRNSAETNFINFNEEKALNEMEILKYGVKNTLKMEFAKKRTAFLNEKALQNPSKLAGNFNAIVFSPADIETVSGSPAARRKFVDIGIAQIYPQYIEILKDYIRSVKQRNEIIRDYKYDKSLGLLLDAFEENIAKTGEKIIKYRERYVELLGEFMPQIYSGLSSFKEKAEVIYIANTSTSFLREKLFARRRQDGEMGTTGVGPHRDDLDFRINGVGARNYGSQGQKRSIALCLKLSQAEVINQRTNEYPVCFLDDVMSELDEKRQNYILNHIKDWQSFITVCDTAAVSRAKVGKIIKIKDGKTV